MLLKLEVIFKKIFSKSRKFIFKNYREHILSKTICHEIEKLEKLKKKRLVKILDFGSGHNPVVINKIMKNLTYNNKSTKFLAYCYDFYTEKELKIMNNNSNIKFFDIKSLSNSNVDKFDFCLIIDVLHHIGLDNSKKIFKIITKLKKKSKFIIIKDH